MDNNIIPEEDLDLIYKLFPIDEKTKIIKSGPGTQTFIVPVYGKKRVEIHLDKFAVNGHLYRGGYDAELNIFVFNKINVSLRES